MKIASFIFLLLSLSCTKTEPVLSEQRAQYDIAIYYTQQEYRFFSEFFDRQASKDTLHLFVESGFQDDILDIEINGKHFFKDTVLTAGQDGLAEYIALGKIASVNDVGVRVNNGPMLFMEMDGRNHLLTLNFNDSVLTMSVLEHAPFYD